MGEALARLHLRRYFRGVSTDSAPAANPNPGFAATRWSLVWQLRAGDEAAAARALEELCLAYWQPLYSWARRSGLEPADAEDRVQGFLVAVLENRLFERADAERGRLRTFLLTAFRRYLRDEAEKATATRRGGGKVLSFDAAEGERWIEEAGPSTGSEEHRYDRAWALTVLDRAMGQVEESYRKRGKESEFARLRPFLTESGTAADYAAAGNAIGLGVGAFKVALHRLRERFAQALRDVVRDTVSDPSEVEVELSCLLDALRE